MERSLQAVEILHSIAIEDKNERQSALIQARLRELKRVTLSFNKLECVMSIMIPLDDPHFDNGTAASRAQTKGSRVNNAEPHFFPGELVVAIVDAGEAATAVPRLLRVLAEDSEVVPLKGVGLVREEVTLQPSLLTLTVSALKHLQDYILPPIEAEVPAVPAYEDRSAENGTGSNGGPAEKVKKRSTKGKPALELLSTSKGKTIGASEDGAKAASPNVDVEVEEGRKLGYNMTRSGVLTPRRVRVLGHSAGGAVAAYVSMVLDGALNVATTASPSLKRACRPPSPSPSKSSSAHSEQQVELEALVGSFKDKVRCVALGAPPCISRSVVPRFVTSVICGDDIVPRLNTGSHY